MEKTISLRDLSDDSFDPSSVDAIVDLFEKSKALVQSASEVLLKSWNVYLGDLDDIQLNLENQIENLLKINDPIGVARIIETFFTSALSTTFQIGRAHV